MIRLFCAVIVISEIKDLTNHIDALSFIGWYGSREEALGTLFEQVRQQQPKAKIEHHYISDITDAAKQGVTNGAFA